MNTREPLCISILSLVSFLKWKLKKKQFSSETIPVSSLQSHTLQTGKTDCSNSFCHLHCRQKVQECFQPILIFSRTSSWLLSRSWAGMTIACQPSYLSALMPVIYKANINICTKKLNSTSRRRSENQILILYRMPREGRVGYCSLECKKIKLILLYF